MSKPRPRPGGVFFSWAARTVRAHGVPLPAADRVLSPAGGRRRRLAGTGSLAGRLLLLAPGGRSVHRRLSLRLAVRNPGAARGAHLHGTPAADRYAAGL